MSSMATNVTTFSLGPEDPLALLPRTPVREFKKNDVIYDPDDHSETLYLVIDGRVKISRLAEGGREVVLDFYHKDYFFGETGFLGSDHQGEQAIALDKTAVMLWTVPELKRLMIRTPALGPALLRVLSQKLVDANNRIESFCLDPINRRLVKTLLHQLLDLLLRGRPHDRGKAYIPLRCDFEVRRQTGHVGEALGFADRPLVERGNPGC